MNSMKTYIYILKHPETNEIRYVGKTTNIKRRFAQHKNKKCLEKTASKKLASWILKLLKNNLIPIMEIIEECDDNWVEREKYWVSFYGINNLCNLSEGGDGVGHNDYTKTKIKNSLTGRKRTNEEKKAISKAMMGKKRPNSGKAISEAHKKRYESLEERRKHGIKLSKSIKRKSINGDIIEIYPSMRETSRLLCLDVSCISRACKTGKPYKGFFYTYEETELICISKLIDILKNRT